MNRTSLRHSAGNAAAAVLLNLPRLVTPRSARVLAPAIGRLIRRIDWSRGRVDENLGIAFGDEMDARERSRLADRFYAHLVRFTCELSWLSRWDTEALRRSSDIVGLEHLARARAEGRGVILLTGHMGNWEVCGARLAVEGVPLLSIARKQGDSPAEMLLARTRERFGVNTVLEPNIREPLRWLRSGKALVLFSDRRHATTGGVCVPFFGKPANSVPGPAWFALRTGSPVLPAASWRRPDGTLCVEVRPPLTIIRTGDQERETWLNTAQFQLALESFVREHPEQWVWHRRRWRLSRRQPGRLYEEMVAAGEPARSLAAAPAGGS
jgi:Kdo2-lipid IVA lauroyltransferase/acyltransferase